MPAQPEPYCTVQAAAEAYSVDPKTIRRMVARGELAAVRVGHRSPGSVRDTRPIRIPIGALASAFQPVAESPALAAILEPVGGASV